MNNFCHTLAKHYHDCPSNLTGVLSSVIHEPNIIRDGASCDSGIKKNKKRLKKIWYNEKNVIYLY